MLRKYPGNDLEKRWGFSCQLYLLAVKFVYVPNGLLLSFMVMVIGYQYVQYPVSKF